MMNFIEKVGSIKVYTEHFPDNSIEVRFFNGTDLVAHETYLNGTEEKAIADLFSKKLDTFTEEWIWLNCPGDELTKLSNNTYRVGEKDWFCRIDNTRYFKHFFKSADEFTADKNGKRIIDR